MKQLNEIRLELQKFNGDVLVSSIREKYNTPSFFEMIDKSRSENVHSAFLSWVFRGQGIPDTIADSPIYLLMNLLAKKSCQQNTCHLMPSVLQDAILSRKIRIDAVKSETEVSISDLAGLALDTVDPKNDSQRYSYLTEIIRTVGDRADIVVKCDVKNCDPYKHLLLIVENKVDSKEGPAKAKPNLQIPAQYSSLSQTDRYYDATYHNASSDTAVVYIYLTPDDLKKKAICQNFINISYQEILEEVIDKLINLQEGSITSRTRMLLQEYKNEITYPHIDDFKNHVNIAYPKIAGIEKLWGDYRFLLHCIVCASSTSKGFAVVGNNVETYYFKTHQDTVDFSATDPNKITSLFADKNGKVRQSTNIANFKGIVEQNGYEFAHISSDTLKPDAVGGAVLEEFESENMDILTTIFGAVSHTSAQYADEAQDMLAMLNANGRDNTKYFLSYNNVNLTSKPVAKSEVVFLIFKKWAEENNADRDMMRNAFNVSINPYYESKKYFQHLFYDFKPNYNYYYDGTLPNFGTSVQCVGTWDFYNDANHQYSGITNLKMWRKDAFESLLAHLKNNHANFWKELQITDQDGTPVK